MSTTPPMSLAEIIDRAMVRQQVTSINALAKVARRAGYGVTNPTLSQMRAGTYQWKPTKQTLEALAHLSGQPLRVVYAAAELAAPPDVSLSDQVDAIDDADNLNPRQREVVKSVIRAFVDANKAVDDARAGVHEGGSRVVYLSDDALNGSSLDGQPGEQGEG